MTKNPYQNELRKREFFQHLKGADGFAESSINSFSEAISQWQSFSDNDDFSNFNKTKAMNFVAWLKTRKSRTESGQVSLTSQYSYLRYLQKFFRWLSDQPSYRNKIIKSDIEFLRLPKKEVAIAISGKTKKIPSLDEVKKIIEAIEIKNEIDKRDRAIICLALLTGIRISALVTLKMKSFDKKNMVIDQNPADGVKTKNSKSILTPLFPLSWGSPKQYFIEWFEYLEEKGFGPEDPIFPSTLNDFGASDNSYSKELVSKEFWSGTGGARKIFEKRCKNANLPYFNPHSFRHSIVSILSKKRLTEEEKRAISLTLGHANVGTTFGSYGYGSMSNEKAVEIVKGLNEQGVNENSNMFSDEEKVLIKKIMRKVQ